MNSDLAISIEHLSKKYLLRHQALAADGKYSDELWALKDINLEIRKGESVGIFGDNGSGKSTLLKLIAGITSPTEGKICIRGKVASILDIGAGFHPDLTGRENVFLNGQLLGFGRKELKSKFKAIAAFSGIEEFIDEPVKTYSNGMYLRLAFSIMAHLDFDIYLFDEVLTVGDADFSVKTKKVFEDLVQSNKTILIVSHSINHLYQQDKYVLLESGVLREISNQKSLLTKYFEKAVTSSKDVKVYDRNLHLFEFPTVKGLRHVKVTRIDFIQESQPDEVFYTTKPFIFTVEYEKLATDSTIDIVLSISDTKGDIILSSPPFLVQEFRTETEAHKVVATCTIPANLFNAQVYQLNLYFLKDVTEVAGTLNNLFLFKPIFYKKDDRFNAATTNIPSYLVPAFDWKIDILPK